MATYRAVCEKPQSGVTWTRSASMWRSTSPQTFGHQLRRLHPGILHIDQTDGQAHRRLDFAGQLDLGHLAAGELQGELMHLRSRQVREQRPIAALAHGPAAIIPETHVHD